MLFLYNLLFPLGFLFFLPGLLWKLWRRPGWKKTFGERFGSFSADRVRRLQSMKNVIWIHSVSVGETVIALGLLREWRKRCPDRDFVLSTTTTTGQALAREKAPPEVEVIFCPIDMIQFVWRTLRIVRPRMLVILETEIWPNLIRAVRRSGGRVALVNGRMSDHSMKGYRRFSVFFSPVLMMFDRILVQTPADAERYLKVSPDAHVEVGGNMKFDQDVPENLEPADLAPYFGSGPHTVLLAASTHPGEEELIARTWREFPGVKLVIVPRHAERGGEIADTLKKLNIKFWRRSAGGIPPQPVDCLLADTTGEMLKFIQAADIVIMGKSLAGQNEGHNLIEPALLGKPIVTGAVLKNFRQVLEILKGADALALVHRDADLKETVAGLLADPARRRQLGARARAAIAEHKGATIRNIEKLEELIR